MQFSESWLREFINPKLSSDELANVLTNAGMEVEEQKLAAPFFSQVVVAEILETEKHPNADRLRICKVNSGSTTLQIVCGAPNARPGIRVPLALVGAQLPSSDAKPFIIKQGKIRDVDSFGMLCSCEELGIEGDSAGLLELPQDAPVGKDLREYLSLNDTIFTLKLTPNLGHCLSVNGIARELAALTNTTVLNKKPVAQKPSIDTKIDIKIENTDLCGRFSARVVTDLNTKAETPAWMKERLIRSGQRPVSVLVDISNYVMFELGSPNHIFDFDSVKNGLIIRWAKKGETLTLLNGKTIELHEKLGIVADGAKPEALAGIMGGEHASVKDDTKSIIIESAYWHPEAIMGKARALGFTSEASHRFERGVDPEQTIDTIERITELVLEICGGKIGPIVDAYPLAKNDKPIEMRLSRASKVIGIDLSESQVSEIFTKLGFKFSVKNGVYSVLPPTYRFDIGIEADLIEEIIRLIGYNNLPKNAPSVPTVLRVNSETARTASSMKRKLAELGYQETINYSFVEQKTEIELAGNQNPVRLLNPIAAPLSVMRSTLFGSLVNTLQYNIARKATVVRIFEQGRVFKLAPDQATDLKHVKGLNQPRMIGGLSFGSSLPELWGNRKDGIDFYDVKADLDALVHPLKLQYSQAKHPALHPGRSANIEFAGKVIGHIGQLHPKWLRTYDLPAPCILFELELDPLLASKLPNHVAVSRFNAISRDLAFIIPDSVQAGQLAAAMQKSDTLIKSVSIFDVYKPKVASADMASHERSIALRLLIESDKEQLTDEQIQAIVQKARGIAEKQGARLRSQ